MTTECWEPEWASVPGETLRELLDMRGWTQAHLARELGYTLKHVNRVVAGHVPITRSFALALERLDFGTAEFWLTREMQYRLALARESDE